jgi:hypothetical protein
MMFLPAKGDPTIGNYDPEEANYDIWAIEPLTWEADRIDMKGVFHGPLFELLTDKDGGMLIIRAGKETTDFKYSLLGNDIIKIDLSTGEWETLLEKGPWRSYGLEGMTPDGNIICCAEYIVDEERKTHRTPLILNLTTYETTHLEPAPCENYLTNYDLAPSGKYMIEWGMGEDIWIHDIEKGTHSVFVSSEESPGIFCLPGIPGPFNVR